jgi:opacity protein-like surface antigen
MKHRDDICRSCFALLICFLAFAAAVQAQDAYTRVELGLQYSTIELTSPSGGKQNSGFGGRFDWNFNRRLALESQIDFWPENYEPLLGVQGGQTLQAVFGIRAKVVQTRRFSVFGLVRPGLLHFTDVLDFQNPSGSSPVFFTRPETHFVLNLGGGVEFYLSPRWTLRADIEGDPYRVPNETVSFGSAGSEFLTGKINDTTRVSLGVSYRPGALIENERETNVDGKLELGPLFSTMLIEREGPTVGVQAEPGVGGYASYRIYHVFYLDGDLLYFPRGTANSGPHDGGTILQGTFGIKGGIRRNHFGFFGKVRPGFNSYSDALSSVSSQQGGITLSTSRATTFVLDLGGILEFYPAEHGTLRIEAGDTHLYFGSTTINIDGTTQPVPGYSLRHSIQFTVGYGWRFR